MNNGEAWRLIVGSCHFHSCIVSDIVLNDAHIVKLLPPSVGTWLCLER